MKLVQVLDLGPGARVSLIGGGGKTTTMLAIASDCVDLGMRVLVTTTTKIWAPRHGLVEVPDISSAVCGTVRRELDSQGLVFAGQFVDREGKVHGLLPQWVCALGDAAGADLVLCEADGSAGKPLKVHGPGEPVVPPCTTHLLVVAGLDALGAPADSAHIHRLQVFEKVFGPLRGDFVSSGIMAAVVQRAARRRPSEAAAFIVLNKADDKDRIDAATRIAGEQALTEVHVLATKHGHVVANFRAPAGESLSRA